LILNLSDNFPGSIQFFGTTVKALEIENTNFTSKKFKNIPNSIIYASNSLNLNSPVDVIGKLYIYAPDLIEFQFVGNIKAPLPGICIVCYDSYWVIKPYKYDSVLIKETL
jgi:hypothetical protein